MRMALEPHEIPVVAGAVWKRAKARGLSMGLMLDIRRRESSEVSLASGRTTTLPRSDIIRPGINVRLQPLLECIKTMLT